MKKSKEVKSSKVLIAIKSTELEKNVLDVRGIIWEEFCRPHVGSATAEDLKHLQEIFDYNNLESAEGTIYEVSIKKIGSIKKTVTIQTKLERKSNDKGK